MKKTFKSIITLALSLVLLIPTNSFAQGPSEAPVSANITKKLVKTETNAVTPIETFNFELTPVIVPADTKLNNLTVYTGKEDLLELDNSGISYSAVDTDLEKVEELLNVNKDVKDDTKVGIYRYELGETAGSTDGMSYDETKYIIDLYVTLGGGGKLAKIVAYKKDEKATPDSKDANIETGKVEDIVFKNTYTTHSLTVSNQLKGNAAVLSDKSKITVTVHGADGETYVTSDGVTLTSGVPQTFEIGNNGSINIIGLSEGDTYTVTETETNGYTPTNLVTTATPMGTESKTVAVINTKVAVIPTGIVETFGAFIIMMGITGGFAYVYFKLNKKRA